MTALVAGFAHALEADHVAAVTTFVSRRPHPLRALRFGIRWGLGHSLALLVIGGAVILLDFEIAPALVQWLELGVGIMLVGLGAAVLASFRHRRAPADAHESALYHPPHAHGAADVSGWVGAAHGIAGTAGFLALLPVALIGSPWLAGGYLLCFGVGTVAAMGLYALFAGLVFHSAGGRVPALAGWFRAAAGTMSVAVGVFWVAGAIL